MSETLEDRFAGLSPAKRALVEQLRRAKDAETDAIPRRHGSGPAPLSFSQELLWRIEQNAPGLSTYNVPRAMRIAGRLDVRRLQRALDVLVERHEVLRTAFELHDGAPVAIVRAARSVELRSVDLRSVDERAREDALHRTLRDAAAEPFDLAGAALLRAVLVRLGDDESALLLVWHHLASDETAAGVLL
ncbi:MAG: non-ribosomal peptide synthetase, partial [Candidatus Eremiobacteraeota bacterium]|nr:non-ribosomal peptide synthetase [Candidatus Eremiobacteraeota bacterium]